MAAFSTLQTNLRDRLLEPTARFYTDAQIKTYLNYAYKDFVRRTKWGERLQGIPLVANQYEYAVSSDFDSIKALRFQDQYRVVPKQYEDFLALVGTGRTSTSTRPEFYTVYPWDARIRIWPVPSAASPSTTLNGAVSSTSATSITVTSTSTFPSSGYVLIDSELILFYSKTSTTLEGCVRGAGRSTAATHLNAATVSVTELQAYYTYIPADMSADADVPITPGEYDEALILYATNIGLFKRQKYAEAQDALKRYEQIVQAAAQDRLMESQEADHLHVRDSDHIEYGY